MVLKQKYGDEKMRRFLKYELDRYLAGRGTEQKGEQPLLRADGAAYVHYQKGAHALYALQDAIGEKAMDDALSTFVSSWRFKGPPYATSRDLIAELRRVTPRRAPGARSTTSSRTSRSSTAARSRPRRASAPTASTTSTSSSRRRSRAPTAPATRARCRSTRSIDIGVQDAKGGYLLLEKRRVKSGENRFTVDGRGRARARRASIRSTS